MTSARENIIAYAAAQLASVSGVSGRVFRSRPEAVRKEELPCVLVEPIAESYQNTNPIHTNAQLQIRVTVLIASDEPDVDVDPIWISAYDKMTDDRTLGGRCFDVEPLQTAYVLDAGDLPTLALSTIYNITYRTLSDNPEVFA